MPIEFHPAAMLFTLVWNTTTFRSGGGTTTLAFANDDTATSQGTEDLALRISNEWSVDLRPQTDNSMTLTEVRWETNYASGSVPVNLQGSRSVESPPSNCALLVSYYAAGKGRRNRGRNYWPGLLGEPEVAEDGTVLAARVTLLKGLIDNMFDGIYEQQEDLTQRVAQSTYPEQKSEPITPWPTVVQRVVQPIIGTQRRRVRP